MNKHFTLTHYFQMAIVALFVMIIAAINTTPSAATNKTDILGNDLALNKPATASASSSGLGPEGADNGSWTNGQGDKWYNDSTGDKWWQVDLGAVYNVGQFVIYHSGAGGEDPAWNTREFNIQVSTDNVNWTTEVTVTDNTANITTNVISPTNARYVRLNVTQGEQFGSTARIYEVLVYDSSQPTPTPTPAPLPGSDLALNRSTTGSGFSDPNETPAKAANGTWTGGERDKWYDANSANKWWQVDLGGVYSLKQFVIYHSGAGGEGSAWDTRDFNIQVSTDNVNWTTPVTVTGNTSDITTHNISLTNGRYVRLNVITPEQGAGGAARIYEVMVYDSRALLSAGKYHTCLLNADATITCWGDNSFGQSTPPAGTFKQVSPGYINSCAVKSDSTLVCWGDDTVGESDAPSGTFIQVSNGVTHACGLKSDGSIVCWGEDSAGQLDNIPTGTFTQISAGGYHTCALRDDGTIACWGSGSTDTGVDPNHGQLLNIPTGSFVQIATGVYHTCALAADGSVTCWGLSDFGLTTPPAGTFKQISAGGPNVCGVKDDGTIACWGSNNFGQAVPPAGTFTQVTTGYHHSCALKTDATIVCWGDDSLGQLDLYTISGSAGTPGATLNYTVGTTLKTATADESGNYSLNVPQDWSGTVTPSLAGYTFAPASIDYTNVLSNQTSQDYTATAITYSISGNAGIAGATLSYTDGTTKTATAANDGRYSLSVSYNWTGTVTPTKTHYSFTPAQLSYTNVLSDQTDQNYAAAHTVYTSTFKSIAGDDGWVLESAQGSGVGGTLNASSTIVVGDDAANRQYRSILSFNTTALTSGAAIQSAVLKIKWSATYNSNPFTWTNNYLRADIKTGVFGTRALEVGDYIATASCVNGIANFSGPDANSWYSGNLSVAGRGCINLTSLTQVRLRFSTITNGNATADFLRFLSGENSGNAPQLIITYTLP